MHVNEPNLKLAAAIVIPFRAVGKGGIGGCGTPQDWQISHIREIGRSIGRLFGNKKYVYTAHMNEKMAAFKYSFQCYKCNSLLIEENRENRHFPNDKICHCAENMSLFG